MSVSNKRRKLAKKITRGKEAAISPTACRKKYMLFLMLTAGMFAIAATSFYVGELSGTYIENNLVGVTAFICGVFCLAESMLYFIAGAIITVLGRHKIGINISELSVVFIVIAILAAITFAGYSTIKLRIVNASIKSDLVTNKNVLNMYYVDHGSYPISLDSQYCPEGPSDKRYCLKASSGNIFTYEVSDSNQKFTLYAENPAIEDRSSINSESSL